MSDVDLDVLVDSETTYDPNDVPDLMEEAPVSAAPPVVRTIAGLNVTQVDQRVPLLNILIYGQSGVGKTLLAGSSAAIEAMSPVLIIDVEGGTFSLREKYPQVDVVRVESWNDMKKVYDALYDGKLPYNTVVLDSLTEIQKFSMYRIMLDVITKDSERDPDIPSVREWGKSIEQIRRLVRAFRDLPINTIFTALVIEDKDARSGLWLKKPYLPGKLSGEVAAFLDIVVYYYMKQAKGEDEMKRLLLTGATETVVAKDRSDRLPMVMDSPTMSDIYNAIFQTNSGKRKGHKS